MFAIPNQSPVPKAYELFTKEDAEEGGSLVMLGGNRDRLVDCVEEFVKDTIIMREHFDLFGDRFSERKDLDMAKWSLSRISRPHPEQVEHIDG
jgi:arsenical resistance protein ArsH